MSATIERNFHLANQGCRRGGYRRVVEQGVEPEIPTPALAPQVHPLARRMAMAIRCLHLIQSGAVADAATLASLAQVTRARMTQLLNLTLLAPDIQAAVLDLSGDATVGERDLHRIGASKVWVEQRRAWQQVTERLANRVERCAANQTRSQ